MNIGNLSEGLIVPNYRELCSLIGEKVKTGNSKMAQLKELENYIEYEKDGNRFVITKILTEQELIVSEIKRGRKNIYTSMIEILLLDTLANKGDNLIISKKNLIKSLNLVNDNYDIGYKKPQELANHFNMELHYVQDFYKLNNSNLTNIVNGALHSLSSKRMIDYKVDTMIKKYDEMKQRLINPLERQLLLVIDKECMEKFNIHSVEELNKKVNNVHFQKIKDFRDDLIRERTNIEYFYKVFDIVINHEFIESEKLKITDFILKSMERDAELVKLNNTFSINIIVNAEKRNKKVNGKITFRNNENYVEYFKLLVANLIEDSCETLDLDSDFVAELYTEEELNQQLPF